MSKLEYESAVRTAADLGQLLRASRKASRMTLEEAALVCGVSKRNLSEIERGKATAEIGRVLKLLEQFGIMLVAKPKGMDSCRD